LCAYLTVTHFGFVKETNPYRKQEGFHITWSARKTTKYSYRAGRSSWTNPFYLHHITS